MGLVLRENHTFREQKMTEAGRFWSKPTWTFLQNHWELQRETLENFENEQCKLTIWDSF